MANCSTSSLPNWIICGDPCFINKVLLITSTSILCGRPGCCQSSGKLQQLCPALCQIWEHLRSGSFMPQPQLSCKQVLILKVSQKIQNAIVCYLMLLCDFPVLNCCVFNCIIFSKTILRLHFPLLSHRSVCVFLFPVLCVFVFEWNLAGSGAACLLLQCQTFTRPDQVSCDSACDDPVPRCTAFAFILYWSQFFKL